MTECFLRMVTPSFSASFCNFSTRYENPSLRTKNPLDWPISPLSASSARSARSVSTSDLYSNVFIIVFASSWPTMEFKSVVRVFSRRTSLERAVRFTAFRYFSKSTGIGSTFPGTLKSTPPLIGILVRPYLLTRSTTHLWLV